MKKLLLMMLLVLGGLAYAEPREREREILKERPSGFWTSNRPAVGGAYRWRLLGLGMLIATGAGFLIVRTIRKANAERSQRTR